MTGLLNLSSSDYHADQTGDPRPSLSAGIANILLAKSPRHAWHAHPRLNPDYRRREEERFDIGTVIHAALLEGNAEACCAVLDYPDWRTKAAQQERDEARAAGLVPLLVKHWDAVLAMYDAALVQLEAHEARPTPFTDGKPEQTLVWEEEGVLCRSRLDWIHNDRATVSDFKSTSASANPETWTRTMFSIGADVQVAFHGRGFRAVFGRDPDWRYVVQETYPPYALSVVGLAPGVLELANHKVDAAIAAWKDCLERDVWPAYPSRVAYAELPAWIETAWMEREAREAA
jgi:hypothetical protein